MCVCDETLRWSSSLKRGSDIVSTSLTPTFSARMCRDQSSVQGYTMRLPEEEKELTDIDSGFMYVWGGAGDV